jgi:hypothetical protein
MPATEPPLKGWPLRRMLAWVAVAMAGLALAWWWQAAPHDAPEVDDSPLPQASLPSRALTSATPSSASTPGIPAMPALPTSSPRSSVSPAAASQDLAAHVPPGQAPAMAEVIQRLNQAGVHSGLGAFNPPGTRPPLIGLAVPQDFELPPGFVRHHQATDDGQRIEAVLMFAPDHPYVQAHPDLPNRVVPPEMAPEGLPLRTITLPAPRGRQP